MQTAGHAQGIKLTAGINVERAQPTSFETERRFYATVASGTGGQLMAAYRQEVERIIIGSSAQIYETGFTGTTNDVQDFSYCYTWGGTDGIVRAFSFTGSSGKVQIVIVCYEHTK